MTFLPTDAGFNFFANAPLLVGIAIVFIVGITLATLWCRGQVGGGSCALGVVAIIGSFIAFICYLAVMSSGAAKVNNANLSANLKQKYDIDVVLSVEDVRYKDNDLIKVSVDGVHHELWLGQDMGSYEPVLFSGDGKSDLDIKTIEK